MARPEPAVDPELPPGLVPPGTTELGIDIVKVDRIAAAIDRFGRHRYSTVTDLARLRGWSTSVPRATAVW